MVRTSHYVIACLGLAAMSVHFYAAGVSEEDPTDLAEHRSEQIDRRVEGWKQFQAELYQTLGAVVDEGMSLETAVDQIIQAATQHYPPFLKNVRMLRGPSLRYDVSETIVEHFAANVKFIPNAAQVATRLRAEQAKLRTEPPSPQANRQ